MTGIQGGNDKKIKCENIEVVRKKIAVSKCNCLNTSSSCHDKRYGRRKFKFNLRTAFGFFVGVIGVVIIYFNESYAIDFTIHYNRAVNTVVEVENEKIHSENEGKLIFIYGKLLVDEPLTEPEYGVSIQCVKLKQRVQMYQWIEKRSTDENDDEYIYEGEWKSKLISSKKYIDNETYQNPISFPLESKVFVNEGVRVGEYYISDEFKNEFKDFTQITGDTRPENKNIKMHFGLYYHTENIWKPEVGDVRVQFSYAGLHGENVNLVGKQVGQYIYPFYNMSNGYNVHFIELGPKRSLADILHIGHNRNIWSIRIFRFLAIVSLFLSSHCILQHIRNPSMLNFFISVSTTSIVTSYVWYWNYPFFSRKLLLTVIISPIILVLMFGRKFKLSKLFRW